VSTAVVGAAVASKPGNGGNAWSRLGWLAGLEAIGFEAWLVERLVEPLDPRAVAWFDAFVDAHGLADRVVLLDEREDVLRSPPGLDVDDLFRDAALLLNVSGHLPAKGRAANTGMRIFLDDDPGFTQIWEAQGSLGSRLADHHLHLTYGTAIGGPSSSVPTVDRTWHPVLPPVSIAQWDGAVRPAGSRFTTVGTWRGPFGSLDHDGCRYGLKVHEFRRILDLPSRVPAEFDLAMAIHADEVTDLASLAAGGWSLTEPLLAAGTTDRYRRWIEGSTAELSAAQGVYVGTACGWVSDRTACYLAAGRPAVVQHTGVVGLPLGEGLLTFEDLDGAVAAAEAVLGDVDGHAGAARSIAETWFAADRVVAGVCELASVAP
jgi:hypothetical protein